MMRWRPRSSSRAGLPARSASRSSGDAPVSDPFLRGLIIAALVVGLVGLGLVVGLTGNRGQSNISAAVQPSVPPVAPTAAPTAAAAAATAAPAPTAAAAAAPATVVLATSVPEPITGNAEAGRALFAAVPAGLTACNVCHYVNASEGVLVGPNLSGIATTAGSRVAGQSAVQYLRASITAPNDYVVDTFVAGVMPQTYGALLTPEQVDDLVAYLMTLK